MTGLVGDGTCVRGVGPARGCRYARLGQLLLHDFGSCGGVDAAAELGPFLVSLPHPGVDGVRRGLGPSSRQTLDPLFSGDPPHLLICIRHGAKSESA